MSKEKEEFFSLASEIEEEVSHPAKEEFSYIMRTLVDAENPLEDSFQNTLRPNNIAEYVGQEKVVQNLSIAIAAAKRRGETLC